jgi:peptide/nickel transport system permease protein
MSIVDRGDQIASPVTGLEPVAVDGQTAIRARGYWELIWLRFKRDKAAIAGGAFVLVLVLAAFIAAPIASSLLGHGPNDQFSHSSYVANNYTPVGPMTRVDVSQRSGAKGGDTTLFILGADGTLGRDEFLRLLYGAQVSLIVSFFATFTGVGLGVLLGVAAGYFGGWWDTIVSRLTEMVMAFPFLLFAISLASTIGDRLNSYTVGGLLKPGILTVAIVLAVFSWFYPARIMRAQVLSLREKEFVEAARMVGASDFRIMRSHLLPHLVGPIIIYSTLIFATNILGEASLSYLGLGVQEPTASWGSLLETASHFYTVQPWLMLWPGMAILLATLAFNLLGDGLRDAFDPRASR